MILPIIITRRRGFLVAVALGLAWGHIALPAEPASLAAATVAAGVRIAAPFRVTLFADAPLVADVQAMTIDAAGRVVVSGPGYIKTLIDQDNNGFADEARWFAPTRTGSSGLCVDMDVLFSVNDGQLQRYLDRDGNGVVDEEPRAMGSFNAGEFGAHNLRKGPDGSLYLIGGSGAGLGSQAVNLPNSPIREVQGGALWRITADGANYEVLAHGFRNPTDFDFSPLGEVVTLDCDAEGDLFLPWHAPVRLLQVAHGGHHGWVSTSPTQGWHWPAHFADIVEPVQRLGRGVPAGMIFYRHYQFPAYYRNGLFTVDWSFGRVLFFPYQARSASYSTQPEVFIEPVGDSGFTPTALAVAPDGSLLISTGGRKTRGAVYRITHPPIIDGVTGLQENLIPPGGTGWEVALLAPQPLDAWSRVQWIPTAKQAGSGPFGRVVVNETVDPLRRIRAVEVLTEVFGGLSAIEARQGARASPPIVRARVAWSLGRSQPAGAAPLLVGLASDPHPMVRGAALESIMDARTALDPEAFVPVIAQELGDAFKRNWQMAIRAAVTLPETAWTRLGPLIPKADPRAQLGFAFASIGRTPSEPLHRREITTALNALRTSREAAIRLDALRLIMIALGDYRLIDPTSEVLSTYELNLPPASAERDAVVAEVLAAARRLLPTADPVLDVDLARMLAMLSDADPGTTAKVIAAMTPGSTATTDFHHLAVLSRLRAPWPRGAVTRVVSVILQLDRKLGGLEALENLSWGQRLGEVVRLLSDREPTLPDELLKQPGFVIPAHLKLVQRLGPAQRERAARLFLTAVRQNPRYPWSRGLVSLLGGLPRGESRTLIRDQWPDPNLREDILYQLAVNPEAVDRERLLTGVESGGFALARSCLMALRELPADPSPTNLLPILRLLRQLHSHPEQSALRQQILSYIKWQTGQRFVVEEGLTDGAALQRAYGRLFEWFLQANPELGPRLVPTSPELIRWRALMKNVPWDRGDPLRGADLAAVRGCAYCHAGTPALGPDLGGVTSRFSRAELVEAIVNPDRDVAPQCRETRIRTRSGGEYSGVIVFESVDGVILQTSPANTVRLARGQIQSRQPSPRSLMPSGGLAGLQPKDLADLHAFLRSLPLAK